MSESDIDVIIAVYNGEQYIEEAIKSVQAQTFKNLNIIIANDGSTDGTALKVGGLQKADSRIRLLSYNHRGVSATLNGAILASSAPYIAFLDADDLWHERKLEIQLDALQHNHDAMFCFCMLQEFEDLEENLPRTHTARATPIKGYSKIALLCKRSVFSTYGLFNESIAIGDFVDWFARAVRENATVIMLDEVLTYRRVHQNNTTRFATKSSFLTLIKTHLDEKRKQSIL